MQSVLLHSDDVGGLHLLPRLDFFEEVLGGDLVVLDDAGELQFIDSEGHGQQLDLLAPGEPVDLQREDLLGEHVQVGLLVEDLDVEDQDGLGHGLRLLRLLGRLGVAVRCRGGGLLNGLLGGLVVLLGGGNLAGPGVSDYRGEEVDEVVPVVEGGRGFLVGDSCINKWIPLSSEKTLTSSALGKAPPER